MGTLMQALPSPILRRATPERILLFEQFIRFGIVGVCGFTIDTATVYAIRSAVGLYLAGCAGYFTAASGNWLLNRIWTFRGVGSGPAHRQWIRFLLVNLGGFVLNRGTYALMVAYVALAARQPVIAVAAGAIAGLFLNFGLSRRLVFR